MTTLMNSGLIDAGPTGADVPAPASRAVIYAGFWRRFMAAGIDGMIMLMLVVALVFATSGPVSQVNGTVMVGKDGHTVPLSEIARPHVVVTRDGPMTTTTETISANVGLQTIRGVVTRTTVDKAGTQSVVSTSSNLSVLPSPLLGVLTFALWLLYTSLLEGSRLQGTLGKRAMFLRVADEAGRPLTLLRAFARNALKLVSAVPVGIGYLMAAWTARKQALHDKLAGCTVKLALP